MIIYDPKITGSFQVNGSSLSSLESIDSVSGSVVDLTAASSSLSTRVSDQESFSSSLDATFATDADLNLVSSSVDSLNAATSSYALENSISGSFTSLSSSIASELLKNTTDTLTGDLTVTGTLTAQDLHVQEVTSSIVFSSGSNKFGALSTDTQEFTGSLQVSGSATFAGTVTSTGLQVNGATFLDVMPNHQSEGIIRIGRYDSNTSRYHDIKSYVSSTQASNYLKFSLHGGTENTVADVLTLKGDLSATFASDLNIAAGKKLAYSSNAFMTPENNVTGAEISTPGDFRVKTGNSPTLALTLGGSQGATFAGIVDITGGILDLGQNRIDGSSDNLKISSDSDGVSGSSTIEFLVDGSEKMRIDNSGTVQIGASSATNFSLGSNSTDFELSAKKNGTDAISMVFKTQASGGTLSEAMRISGAGDTTFASNVGIGITPNDNASVVEVLQLGKGMTIMGNVNDDRATMGANLYLDTSTAFRYVMDGYAGRFSIEDGGMLWGLSATGNAGNVATVNTKMTLLNNGNLGIGQTDPNAKLDVTGNVKLGSAAHSSWTDAKQDIGGVDIFIGSGTNAFTVWDDNAQTAPRFIVRRAGNVGIGTTSPSQTLEVHNTIKIGETGVAGGVLISGDSMIFQIDSDDSSNTSSYRFRCNGTADNGTELMRIQENGNVGIGTTSPSTDLHVNSENAEGSLTLSRGGNNMVSGQGVGSIVFPADYNGTPTNYGKIVTYANALSALRGSIDFKVKSTSGSLLTGLTVYGTSSGPQIGIGTTTPSRELDIQASSGWAEIALRGNTGGGGSLEFWTNSTKRAEIFADTEDIVFRNTATNKERMRIASNGIIYIMGATPSTNNSLQMQYNSTAGTAEIYSKSTGGNTSFEFYTSDSGTTTKKLTIGSNGNTVLQGSSGNTDFKVYDSAGNSEVGIKLQSDAATWTLQNWGSGGDRLRVLNNAGTTIQLWDDNGKVGIGTTDPDKTLTVGGVNPTHGINLKTKSGSNEWQLWSVEQYFSQEGYMRLYYDNTATIQFRANDKSYINGGNVGIGTTSPDEKLHVNGRVQTNEGIISPTFYVARNYGSTSGNFAGYDDITEGDIINLVDHSIGSLNAFAHGQTDPIINGSSDSIDWNYFRLLFRYTNNSTTYTNYTVGFKVARYFYNGGWVENGAEFSGNGMDGARGPRWAVSPWVTTGGTDVPGIGLKYYSNYTHTQTVRVHAIYIQYKS